MKNLKKIVVWLFVCGMMIIPCFAEKTEYKSCTYLFSWNNKYPSFMSIAYTGSDKRLRTVTQKFCAEIAQSPCVDDGGSYALDYFDASQSAFVTILCNSVKMWAQYLETAELLKKQSFLDFWIVVSETWKFESCHWSGSLNDCNYAYHLPQIFNSIENDLFNIRQARYFGISGLSEEFSPQEAANAFSLSAFNGLSIQAWLSDWICTEDSVYYKSTCKTLKNYMVDARNLLTNTKVIDIEKLQELSEIADCENDPDKNILYCGLLWTNSEYKFLNVVYNEYFWYKLFMSYYVFYLDKTNILYDENSKFMDNREDNMEKVSLVQDQLSKSKQAITLSLRSLTEMMYSFPIHIGFLMYQEDAKYFLENASKMYTPIRTLYDKLRNVQIKES